MLGEYHAEMERAHGGAGAAALERAYSSFDARAAAMDAVAHIAAPAWLELTPHAARLERDSLANRGLQCSGCYKSFPLEALSACSACRYPRYCSVACQRSDWSTGHKRMCKELSAQKAR